MRIAVVGTGYVGLCVERASRIPGNDVVCIDKDAQKIQALLKGEIPIFEPGLEDMVRKNMKERRLSFTTELPKGVGDAQVVFIAVATPEGESGDADLNYVLAAAEEVGKAIKQYTVVVNKSTVPVGTADKVQATIARFTQVPFDVVSNPEFLKEGAALDDFCKPDRVVIGTLSERARRIMGDLYAPFVRTGNPILFTDARSAELTKYAANAMLATRISFMNDLAALCEKVGADVQDVRKGMGSDRRIGHSFLFPGCGYGGSCFPKDVKALIATGRDNGLELDLLRAVIRTNERQKKTLLGKAMKHYGSLDGLTFAVWGLAFKPKTDDMREAASVELIEGLLGKGARVQCHDPVAEKSARRIFGDRVLYAPTMYDAVEGSDGLFIVTEWSDFRHPDFDRMKALMRQPVVFDGRNIYEPPSILSHGFTYYAIGRGALNPGDARR